MCMWCIPPQVQVCFVYISIPRKVMEILGTGVHPWLFLPQIYIGTINKTFTKQLGTVSFCWRLTLICTRHATSWRVCCQEVFYLAHHLGERKFTSTANSLFTSEISRGWHQFELHMCLSESGIKISSTIQIWPCHFVSGFIPCSDVIHK